MCHSVIANSVWPHGLHSLPSSIVLGILQGRIVEWAAIPFARGSSWPRKQTQSPILPADSLPCEAPQVWNLHSFSDVWRELQVVGLGHCSLVLLSGKRLQGTLRTSLCLLRQCFKRIVSAKYLRCLPQVLILTIPRSKVCRLYLEPN